MSPALRAQLREAAEKAFPDRERQATADYGCDCGGCTWCLLCMTYGDPMPVPQQKEAGQGMTATADVLTLPNIKIVPVLRVDDLERRKALLTWLARKVLDLPQEAVPVLRDAWAADCGPRAEERWQEFCARLALADAADAGCLDWRLVVPDLTCGERTEVAREIAHQDADDALCLLAGGRQGGKAS